MEQQLTTGQSLEFRFSIHIIPKLNNYTPNTYYQGDQIKKDERKRACGAFGKYKNALAKPKCRRKGNIEIVLKELGWSDVERIYLG
jgi:hypothetical protein